VTISHESIQQEQTNDAINSAVRVAINDASTQIANGTMSKLSEDNPDENENFHTLANLYSDDENIPEEYQEIASDAIIDKLTETYPEFAE
jgi:hypothetical protein